MANAWIFNKRIFCSKCQSFRFPFFTTPVQVFSQAQLPHVQQDAAGAGDVHHLWHGAVPQGRLRHGCQPGVQRRGDLPAVPRVLRGCASRISECGEGGSIQGMHLRALREVLSSMPQLNPVCTRELCSVLTTNCASLMSPVNVSLLLQSTILLWVNLLSHSPEVLQKLVLLYRKLFTLFSLSHSPFFSYPVLSPRGSIKTVRQYKYIWATVFGPKEWNSGVWNVFGEYTQTKCHFRAGWIT